MATKQAKPKTETKVEAPKTEAVKPVEKKPEIIEAPKTVEKKPETNETKTTEPAKPKKVLDALQERKALLKKELYTKSHLKTDPQRTNFLISQFNGMAGRGHSLVWDRRLSTTITDMPLSLAIPTNEADRKKVSNPLLKKYINICSTIETIEKRADKEKYESNLKAYYAAKRDMEAMVKMEVEHAEGKNLDNSSSPIYAGSAQFSSFIEQVEGKNVPKLKIVRVHKIDYRKCDIPFTVVADYIVRKFVEETMNYKEINNTQTKKIDYTDADRSVNHLYAIKHEFRNLYKEFNTFFFENQKVDKDNTPVSVVFTFGNIVQKLDDKINIASFDKISQVGREESKMRGALMQTNEKQEKKKVATPTIQDPSDVLNSKLFPNLFTKKFLEVKSGDKKNPPISPSFSVYLAGMSDYIIQGLAESVNTFYAAKGTLSGSYALVRECIRAFILHYTRNVTTPLYTSLMQHVDEAITICEEIDELTNAGKNKTSKKYEEKLAELKTKSSKKSKDEPTIIDADAAEEEAEVEDDAEDDSI